MMGKKKFNMKDHHTLCLDDIVNPHDLYRKIDEKIDFSFIHELAKEAYSHTGQPSFLPKYFPFDFIGQVKIFLLTFFLLLFMRFLYINYKGKSPFFTRLYIIYLGVSLLSSRRRKQRVFDKAECKNCSYKGSTYCWRQCPYNIWRQKQIE